EPIVRLTFAFSGFEAITSPSVPSSPSSDVSSPVPVDSVVSASVDSDEVLLEPPPQAEIPTASVSAAINMARAISGLLWLNLTTCLLVCLDGSLGVLQLQTLGSDSPLQPRQGELEDQGEDGDDDRARQHPVGAVDVFAEDEVTEREYAGERGDRRGGDDVDRGAADPGQDARHRQRQLDPADDLRLGHADPPRGVDGGVIDLTHADERVGEDGRDTECRKDEDEDWDPDPDHGGDQGDRRQLRDRPAGVADPDRDPFAFSAVAEIEADRDRDQT